MSYAGGAGSWDGTRHRTRDTLVIVNVGLYRATVVEVGYIQHAYKNLSRSQTQPRSSKITCDQVTASQIGSSFNILH